MIYNTTIKIWEWINNLNPRQEAIYGAISLTLFTALVKSIIIPILKIIFNKISHCVNEYFNKKNILDYLFGYSQYKRKLNETFSYVKNPWLAEPQKLLDIYLPVYATSGFKSGKRFDLRDVVGKLNSIVLVGEAGSGKTTALKALALECINSTTRAFITKKIIPVFIELRTITSLQKNISTIDFFEIITQSFNSKFFLKNKKNVERLAKKGQLFLLLDGLDEVNDEDVKSLILEEIKSFVLTYCRGKNPNHLIVSSRPISYQSQLSGVIQSTLQMADFTPDQVRRFILKWNFIPPKSASELLKDISTNPAILDICRSPLILTIITSLYKETACALPDSREMFYRVCLSGLIHRWDDAKNIGQKSKFPAILKEQFLQEFAFYIINNSLKYPDECLLYNQARTFIVKQGYDFQMTSEFINEIYRSGIISVLLTTNEVYFTHRTFTESLASSYLKQDFNLLVKLWQSNRERWFEVCTLYVADKNILENNVSILIDIAQKEDDWSSCCILASESPNVSLKKKIELIGHIENNPSLWVLLDRRSFVALVKMGNCSLNLIKKFLISKNHKIRSNSIYSLGFSREKWATEQLLISLSSDNSDYRLIIQAFSSLGDDALPVISDIIQSNNSKIRLIHSCIDILDNIGSPDAIELIITCLWSSVDAVSNYAALILSNLLNTNDVKEIFDNIEIPERITTNNMNLIQSNSWIKKWDNVNDKDLKFRYIYLINKVTAILSEQSDFPLEIILEKDKLNNIPRLLLIPILINIQEELEHNKKSEQRIDLETRFSRLAKLFPFLGSVLRELYLRPSTKNKKLWSKIDLKKNPPKIIAIREEAVLSFGIIAYLISFVTPIAGIIKASIPAWWLIYLVLLSVGVVFSILKMIRLDCEGYVQALSFEIYIPLLKRKIGLGLNTSKNLAVAIIILINFMPIYFLIYICYLKMSWLWMIPAIPILLILIIPLLKWDSYKFVFKSGNPLWNKALIES